MVSPTKNVHITDEAASVSRITAMYVSVCLMDSVSFLFLIEGEGLRTFHPTDRDFRLTYRRTAPL